MKIRENSDKEGRRARDARDEKMEGLGMGQRSLQKSVKSPEVGISDFFLHHGTNTGSFFTLEIISELLRRGGNHCQNGEFYYIH